MNAVKSATAKLTILAILRVSRNMSILVSLKFTSSFHLKPYNEVMQYKSNNLEEFTVFYKQLCVSGTTKPTLEPNKLQIRFMKCLYLIKILNNKLNTESGWNSCIPRSQARDVHSSCLCNHVSVCIYMHTVLGITCTTLTPVFVSHNQTV